MVLTLAACGGNSGAATIENTEVKEEAAETEAEAPAEDAGEDFHIGIVTGSGLLVSIVLYVLAKTLRKKKA